MVETNIRFGVKPCSRNVRTMVIKIESRLLPPNGLVLRVIVVTHICFYTTSGSDCCEAIKKSKKPV